MIVQICGSSELRPRFLERLPTLLFGKRVAARLRENRSREADENFPATGIISVGPTLSDLPGVQSGKFLESGLASRVRKFLD